MKIKERLHNPIFWIGLAGIAFAAAGVDFNTLTSWELMKQALINIIKNPVAIVAVISAIVGVFTDTSTPGLKDKLD